ncbi:MAG: zf-HC2 domain-containing protein [Burkholderiales bacterium]|jgi:anti-sigma factor RsiW
MSAHVTELLALAAAGALETSESERVAAHLALCAACAARAEEWRHVADGMRRLPQTRPQPVLVARTREAVEALVAERAERAFNRAALAFVVGLAWTLAIFGWFVFDLVAGELALRLARPIGSAAAWYAAYLLAGWLAAGAAAVMLGRRAQEEGRLV